MDKMYQVCVLELSDGREAAFIGLAVVNSADGIGKIRVTKVRMSEPRPLPDDCEFEFLEPMQKEPEDDA